MDEEYEVIVLGSGLKERILSGLLSVDGVKVSRFVSDWLLIHDLFSWVIANNRGFVISYAGDRFSLMNLKVRTLHSSLFTLHHASVSE
ncbi:unnamed protein product [Eruca vesicaria subsp. sativa]|uniref:Uncharacterized protein n=1 Tax=Eruca vesicaria subsp. sativa TaxID=29727 RepID=A0ABC8J1U7_ERUVS|nr:unnamed protein product [Eruca vesicaria subsp. sativa]